jgi:hypothetical protein
MHFYQVIAMQCSFAESVAHPFARFFFSVDQLQIWRTMVGRIRKMDSDPSIT